MLTLAFQDMALSSNHNVTISVFTIRSHDRTMGNAIPTPFPSTVPTIRQPDTRAAHHLGRQSGRIRGQVRIRQNLHVPHRNGPGQPVDQRDQGASRRLGSKHLCLV